MNIYTRILVSCLSAVLSTGAMAAARSSASLSQLNFQIIDLDLSNGYDFHFENAGQTTLSLSANNLSSGESDAFSRSRAGWMIPGYADSSLDHVSARANIDAWSISLAGEALGPGSYSAAGAAGQNMPWMDGNLSLSSHTMVIVSARASVSASASNPADCGVVFGYCATTEYASALASMELSYGYATDTMNVSYSFSDALNVEARATGAHTLQEFAGYVIDYDYWGYAYYRPVYETIEVPRTEQTNEREKVFTAVFINTSDYTQVASLRLHASTAGHAATPPASALSAAPIPEPGTWAMMLAGLALLHAQVRRSRRQD